MGTIWAPCQKEDDVELPGLQNAEIHIVTKQGYSAGSPGVKDDFLSASADAGAAAPIREPKSISRNNPYSELEASERSLCISKLQ